MSNALSKRPNFLLCVWTDELNRLGELPLQVRYREGQKTANDIERLCKIRLQETGYERASENWSAWAANYRLWLRAYGKGLQWGMGVAGLDA